MIEEQRFTPWDQTSLKFAFVSIDNRGTREKEIDVDKRSLCGESGSAQRQVSSKYIVIVTFPSKHLVTFQMKVARN